MKFYQHFSVDERLCLQMFLERGESLREIARQLNRNVSSISRELQRNENMDGSYHFCRATSLYLYRRKSSVRKLRLKVDNCLISYVKKCLDMFWSPEIIVAKWKAEKEGGKLSHSTIYAAIRNKLLPAYSPKKHFRKEVKDNMSTIIAVQYNQTI